LTKPVAVNTGLALPRSLWKPHTVSQGAFQNITQCWISRKRRNAQALVPASNTRTTIR